MSSAAPAPDSTWQGGNMARATEAPAAAFLPPADRPPVLRRPTARYRRRAAKIGVTSFAFGFTATVGI